MSVDSRQYIIVGSFAVMHYIRQKEFPNRAWREQELFASKGQSHEAADPVFYFHKTSSLALFHILKCFAEEINSPRFSNSKLNQQCSGHH
jgi:hypothetical protein